jgi:hypothetical protein
MLAGFVIGFIVGAVVSCCLTMWMDEGSGITPQRKRELLIGALLICAATLGLSSCQVVEGFRQFDTASYNKSAAAR